LENEEPAEVDEDGGTAAEEKEAADSVANVEEPDEEKLSPLEKSLLRFGEEDEFRSLKGRADEEGTRASGMRSERLNLLAKPSSSDFDRTGSNK
jgi:hypothetical protein